MFIINKRVSMRDKFRIIHDLLDVLLTYRVTKPAFLPVACCAMFRLNRYARQRTCRLQKKPIYDLKNVFVQMLYEFGYCHAVVQQQQIFYCWTCDGTGEIYDPWSDRAETCWKCGGTGIYRRHTLYRFHVNVLGTNWIWHQPKDLVTWPAAITNTDPELYQQPGDNTDRKMTAGQISRDLVTVWVALRFARNSQLTLPGFPARDEFFHHIPFPVHWYTQYRHRPLRGWRKWWWHIEDWARAIKWDLIKRFLPKRYYDKHYIPF